MKKNLFCVGLAATLLAASCTKEDKGALNTNTWTVSGKVYTATSVDVSANSNYISGSNGQGSSLDLYFKSLPKANVDVSVQAGPYTANDVSIRSITTGNIVYSSVDNTGGYVSIRLSDGKYTVIMNNVKLVNTVAPYDTVTVSSNFIQP